VELVGAVLSGLLTPDQAADLGLAIAGTPSILTDLLHANQSSASARPAL